MSGPLRRYPHITSFGLENFLNRERGCGVTLLVGPPLIGTLVTHIPQQLGSKFSRRFTSVLIEQEYLKGEYRVQIDDQRYVDIQNMYLRKLDNQSSKRKIRRQLDQDSPLNRTRRGRKDSSPLTPLSFHRELSGVHYPNPMLLEAFHRSMEDVGSFPLLNKKQVGPTPSSYPPALGSHPIGGPDSPIPSFVSRTRSVDIRPRTMQIPGRTGGSLIEMPRVKSTRQGLDDLGFTEEDETADSSSLGNSSETLGQPDFEEETFLMDSLSSSSGETWGEDGGNNKPSSASSKKNPGSEEKKKGEQEDDLWGEVKKLSWENTMTPLRPFLPLKSLDLLRCPNFSGATLTGVLPYLANLQSLQLVYMALPCATIATVLANCTNLTVGTPSPLLLLKYESNVGIIIGWQYCRDG